MNVCSICEGELGLIAYHSEPVNGGRCCQACHYHVVRKAKFAQFLRETINETDDEVGEE